MGQERRDAPFHVWPDMHVASAWRDMSVE